MLIKLSCPKKSVWWSYALDGTGMPTVCAKMKYCTVRPHLFLLLYALMLTLRRNCRPRQELCCALRVRSRSGSRLQADVRALRFSDTHVLLSQQTHGRLDVPWRIYPLLIFVQMCDFGTGNNNKLNWVLEDKQELIDIIETIYRGAKKGRGLVVSPKGTSAFLILRGGSTFAPQCWIGMLYGKLTVFCTDYSTRYRYWERRQDARAGGEVQRLWLTSVWYGHLYIGLWLDRRCAWVWS